MADIDIDRVIEAIHEGLSYRDIAKEMKVPLTTFTDFISKTEHSARVAAARTASADTFVDMAEKVLKEAPRDGIEMQRARELAQLYKWKAAKRNPRVFGERIELDGKVDTNSPIPPQLAAAMAEKMNLNAANLSG